MFSRVLSLIRKEFIAIWKDPKSRALTIIPPLLQLFVFANAITMEIKNIDMVVLDRSNTYESRELVSGFSSSKWFRHIKYVENDKQLEHEIQTQHVQMGMEIQSDFADKLKQKQPTQVLIIVDGRQTNTAAIINSYALRIIDEYSQITVPQQGAKIQTVVRNWFNPNLEYQWFLLVSLITLLALIITLILTSLSIARERELGTFDQLIVSPLTSFEILLGKTIPPLCISMILTCFMTVVTLTVFKVPFVGSPWLFLLSVFVSLLSIVGIGLFISSLCKTQQQALLGVFTFQMPAVLLSGFISPIEDMPVFLQYITWLNPIRFFMLISKGIFLKGMGIEDVAMNYIPLLIIAVITLSVASFTFKQRLD
ncbi:MAG: ABC transporter permease [Candidatus Gastranaerophilales bacterium]|nr:ABC transporter permease [Candidatus Gastranaerophilales bacterium]